MKQQTKKFYIKPESEHYVSAMVDVLYGQIDDMKRIICQYLMQNGAMDLSNIFCGVYVYICFDGEIYERRITALWASGSNSLHCQYDNGVTFEEIAIDGCDDILYAQTIISIFESFPQIISEQV